MQTTSCDACGHEQYRSLLEAVFNILEEDFEAILVNARHVKNVPGQKTDKKDSKLLATLLLAGLLKASFIPPTDIRELRDSVRYHQSLVQAKAIL